MSDSDDSGSMGQRLMSTIWRQLIRRALFRLDAERAHNLMIRALAAYGWLMWPLTRPRDRTRVR